MLYWFIPTVIAASALLLSLGVMLVCFFTIFYSPRKKKKRKSGNPIPSHRIYDPYRTQLIDWIHEVRELPHSDHSITSFDGLRLFGSYYEFKKGAPVEILLHGYRGNSLRDMSGGVIRCRELGHNAFLVDHRASGKSEGRVITFGVKESLDCVAWVNYFVEKIDPDAKIILTGLSMGASTVLTAASMPLPENVVGILADCGFSSTREIVQKVMRDRGLPARFLYPFARLSAILFGGFDPDQTSAKESMKRTSLPVLFFHGDADDFVPHSMSRQNYEACASEKKRLILTPGAGHALCFPIDRDAYVQAMREFFEE